MPKAVAPKPTGCLCDQCAALCCRYIALPIDNPEDANDYDNVRWYLMHENVVVFVEDAQWFIGFFSRCKHLQADNRCGVYETRPRICRTYTTDNCDFHGNPYDYEHLFTSAEQLRAFADEQLGEPLVKVGGERRTPRGGRTVRLPVA